MSKDKQQSRRKFLKSAGKAMVIAPAAMLILNAAIKPRVAQAAAEKDYCDGSSADYDPSKCDALTRKNSGES